MELSTPIKSVKGVGDKIAKLYEKLGIVSVSDLLNHIPRRYEDYSHVQKISTLTPGNVTIKAKIISVKGRYGRNGLHVTEAIASDESGSVGVVWFNQPYRARSITPKQEYFLSGKFDFGGSRLSLQNPSIESSETMPVNSGRILAVYPETKGLSSRQIRKHVANVFKSKMRVPESLPDQIVGDNHLMPLSGAYEELHMPSSNDSLQAAKYRLGFSEIFELTLASMSARNEIEATHAPKIIADIDLTNTFIDSLGFKLTNAQRKATWQVYQDIAESKPMNRLVEGDVGSGKTLVAAMASVMAMKSGYQVVFLAPTEILARQHADTLHKLLKPIGMEDQITLLVGAMTKKQKDAAKSALKSNSKPQLIIGTHALLQKKVEYQDIGLVITDEQHRFGVNQRRHLISKTKNAPHMLSMTATPIPRSLALTVFGELDISIIDEKPPGRKDILTEVVEPSRRKELYKQIAEELKKTKGQAYVVCPVIRPSEIGQMKSVTQVEHDLKIMLKGLNIKSLHGKMKAEEKNAIMSDFVGGKIDVLISTTVIEVGVNVVNSNVMVIESSERFGLAQLHQLRGRVGRASKQGKCYLLTDNKPSKRILAIESTNDGFKLAELDLELRGAGTIYGTRQHGLIDLRIANFSDTKLIASASNAAKLFIKNPKNLLQYPHIKERIKQLQSVVHLN